MGENGKSGESAKLRENTNWVEKAVKSLKYQDKIILVDTETELMSSLAQCTMYIVHCTCILYNVHVHCTLYLLCMLPPKIENFQTLDEK